MIEYTIAKTDEDLQQILNLQQANLSKNLSNQEAEKEGFVTIEHNFNQLKKLNDAEPHIIAKNNNKVIAYLLTMTKQARLDVPVVVPMFNLFDELIFNNKPIASNNYMVVGQVCVDKNFRKLGIVDNCYQSYKKQFENKYDFAVTEIASTNIRSINAHKRIGFIEIKRYQSDNVEWSIVAWNWK